MTKTTTLAAAVLVAASTSEPQTEPEWPDLEPRRTWGLTVADWNADGVGDVLINNHRDGFRDGREWPDLLVVSDGDTWRVELTLPYADRHGCTALDADSNGMLDFFCAVGAQAGDGEGANELWLQTDDGWTEAAAEWQIDDPMARGRHVATLDWNSDGRDDLFVGVAHRVGAKTSAAIWLNRDDRFERHDVDQYGTDCAVPWKDGVVVCDINHRLGTHTWWLRPGRPAVRLGAYVEAVVTDGLLVLVGEDHLIITDGSPVVLGWARSLIGSQRVDLPRPARAEHIRPGLSADDHSIYVTAGGCTPDDEPRVDLPDMVVTHDGNGWKVEDAPNGAGCTMSAHHLLDGRVLVMEGAADGTPGVGRLWQP